jgi:hypothetical protein
VTKQKRKKKAAYFFGASLCVLEAGVAENFFNLRNFRIFFDLCWR